MKANKGLSLDRQHELLRELVHIKFPNTIKLVIDMNGNGEHLPKLFYETWEYENETTKERKEFPPLILDDDEEALGTMRNAIPMIRGVRGTNQSNNTMYTYMKASFENGSLKLPLPSAEMDFAFKDQEISADEYAVFIEIDNLVQELSNIKQIASEGNKVDYQRIVKTAKRDRATSAGYGLGFINELETYNRLNNNKQDDDDWLSYLFT